MATTEIPGGFMQTEIDDVVHVQLYGPLALLLTLVDPKKYKKFAKMEGGKTVIYV